MFATHSMLYVSYFGTLLSKYSDCKCICILVMYLLLGVLMSCNVYLELPVWLSG